MWNRLLARFTSSWSVFVLKNSSDWDGLIGELLMGAEDDRCCCIASMMDVIMALSGVSTHLERSGVCGRSGLAVDSPDMSAGPNMLSSSAGNTERRWTPWLRGAAPPPLAF